MFYVHRVPGSNPGGTIFIQDYARRRKEKEKEEKEKTRQDKKRTIITDINVREKNVHTRGAAS